MKIAFHPKAREELFGAADWYQTRQLGLGDDFYAAVEAAMLRMRAFPEAQPPIGAATRKASLARFPYHLVYVRLAPDTLTIIAVAHMKRRPGYWKRRLPRAP